MKELKIATIGAWGHLGRVLGELDDSLQFPIQAMASVVSDDHIDAYRARHPATSGAAVFDDYRRMLDQIRPNVVVISTRIDRIAPIAIEAAQRGCHLICEKPLAIDHQSLRKLWDTCVASRVQCTAILNNHVHPAIVAARQVVADGRLGPIALANAHKSYKWGTRPQWFGQREVYGGTIPWVGIHALDFIYSITSQTFTSVAAMQSNVAHPDRAECEDHCALIMSLSGGAHASASLDLLRPAAADSHGDDRIRVVGARGALEADLTRNTCTLMTDQQPTHELPLPKRAALFSTFLETIARNPMGPAVSPEMKRAFMLTHVSLVARDAADRSAVLVVERGPWD